MKRITMTEFRKSPGEFILDVLRDGESFMLYKQGKPVARLLPACDEIVINREGRQVAGPRLERARAAERGKR